MNDMPFNILLREKTVETSNCSPTLDDEGILNFCRTGYVMLESVVSSQINARVRAYCDEHDGAAPVNERWYIDNVVLNPEVAGFVRSLLGANFAHFPFAANHRATGTAALQPWHRDGGSVYGPAIDCLQVFYLPQNTTLDMGPTELLPGSHLLFSTNQYMQHYGRIRGSVRAEAPEGSVYITHYGIWHRRTLPSSQAVRDLLKFWYVRTESPRRDWIKVNNFDLLDSFHEPPAPDFGREMHMAINNAAEMFYWLAGAHDEFTQLIQGSNLPIYFGIRA
jgi:hypothetical protein